MYALAMLAEQGNVLAVDASAIIVFFTALLLVGVYNKLLFAPINQVIDERTHRTLGYQAEAQAMLAECDRKLAEYEEALRKARAETYDMLEQHRQAALERRLRLIETTKQQINTQIAEARHELQRQVEETKQQLAGQCQVLAHQLASGLLQRQTGEVKNA